MWLTMSRANRLCSDFEENNFIVGCSSGCVARERVYRKEPCVAQLCVVHQRDAELHAALEKRGTLVDSRAAFF